MCAHKKPYGTSLVIQWLRIHLPMQGTWVQSGKVPPALEQLKPERPGAHAPRETPSQWEALSPQLESSPCSLQLKETHGQR